MIYKIVNLFKAIFIYNRFLFLFNWVGVYRDYKTYKDILAWVNLSETQPYWKKLQFRKDWLNMPYTVYNVTEDFFRMSQKERVYNMTTRYQELIMELQTYDLFETVAFKQRRLKNYFGIPLDAYLIYFRPIFEYIHISSIIGTILIIYLLVKHGILNKLFGYVINFLSMLFN